MQSQEKQANVLDFSCGWHSNTEQPLSYQHTWLISIKSTLYQIDTTLFLPPWSVPRADFRHPTNANSRASQSSSAISFLLPSRYPKKTVAESMKMVCSNMVNLLFKINDCVVCNLLEIFFSYISPLTDSLPLPAVVFSHANTPTSSSLFLLVCDPHSVSSLYAEKRLSSASLQNWWGFAIGSEVKE